MVVDNDNGLKFECNDEKYSFGFFHGKPADEEDQVFYNQYPGKDHKTFPQFVFTFA